MLIIFYLQLQLLLWSLGCSTSSSGRAKLFVSKNGLFFVCHKQTGTLLQVADEETLQKLLESMDIRSVPVLDSNTISDCALKYPSLIQQDNSRDETTRVKVQLAELVSPSSYILSIKKLEGYYLNPCIVFTSNDKIKNRREVLMSWRKANTDKEVLSFGWLNLETMQVNQSFRRPDNYFMGSFTTSQEDARLLIMPDRKIVTVYTGNFGLRKRTKMFCSLGTWNASSLELSFENSYYLHYEDHEHQKNWIPFLYNNTLLFIQKFIPLTTLTISYRDENYKASMKVFSVNDRQNKSTPLPWKGDAYGSEIRGGSTAVFVNDGYLLFFHTLSMQHNIRNYFMGCMHLCPHPPFSIRAMSALPVLKSEWYDGPWTLRNTIDYVVFPIGLALDPDNASVWLSYGRKDSVGEVAKMDISGLMDSMEIVTSCD